MATRLLTRAEMFEKIAPLEAISEVSGPTDRTRFRLADGDAGILAEIGGVELPISTEALEDALVKVPGLQKAAVNQWPVDMLLTTMNWFYEHGDGETRALVHDDKIVSVTKSAVPLFPVSEVLEAVEEGVSDAGGSLVDMGFGNVRLSLDRVTFGVSTPSRVDEPKVGDVVQAGIWVHHSPTGQRAVEIAPYVNRLVCTNGMIAARSLSKWSWRGGSRDEGDFRRWIRAAASGAWEGVQSEFDGLRDLTTQRLNGHASAVVDDLFERHRVPGHLREAVLESLIDEADGTMYGIAQAFNRAANQVSDITHMRHLLLVTGDVVAETERCDSCFRAL